MMRAHFTEPLVVPPGAGLVLAGDESGSAPWSVDNCFLFEVFGATGERLSTFFAGDTLGSAVMVDGTSIERLGPGRIDLPALRLPDGAIPAATPVRLRVTALDYGGHGHASGVFLVPRTNGGEVVNLQVVQ